jgi:hypothetical protein
MSLSVAFFSTGTIVWSEETFRIFQYDRTTKPSLEFVAQRPHPGRNGACETDRTCVSGWEKNLDFAYRLLMPDGSVKHLHAVAHVTKIGRANEQAQAVNWERLACNLFK